MLDKLQISSLPYPDKVFFIVGHPKSGTTWLSRILNSHPQISCAYEGHFFGREDGFLSLEDALRNSIQLNRWMDRRYNHWNTDKDKEISSFAKLLIQYYLQRQVSITGKKIVGDKSPSYIVEPIAKYFPKAIIINLIRDGRDVTVSMAYHRSKETERYMSFEMAKRLDHSLNGKKNLVLPLDFVNRIANTWKEEISICRNQGPKLFGDRYFELKYETLHLDPKNVLTDLFEFLEADTSTKIIDHCIYENSFKRLSGGRNNGEEDSTSFFRKGIVGDWYNVFDLKQNALFVEIAGDQLLELGYKMSFKDASHYFSNNDDDIDDDESAANSGLNESKVETDMSVDALQTVYDASFFEKHRQEKLVAPPIIVPLIMNLFPVESVVDIGCGNGIWLKAFQQNGVNQIKGFDASDLPIDQYFVEKSCITTGCDFSDPTFSIERKYDLAMCLEVAEHLPASSADQLVLNLVQSAPVILFSAAYPGQTGVVHVNEQPPWYWREKFSKYGYVEIDFLRSNIWSDRRVSWWYRQNVTMYVDIGMIKRNQKIQTYFERYRVLPEPEHLTVVSERILKKQLEMLFNNPIKISVIIPTFNGAQGIARVLLSVLSQTVEDSEYEIIVVDNNSQDGTKKVVEKINREYGHRVRYVFEPMPGLLSGRHRGALEGRGEILVFADDDIEATPGWLEAILQAFRHSEVYLVGGPSLPKFESEPPNWMFPYLNIEGDRLKCGPLSLTNLGDQTQEIDAKNVWGLNFAIRKLTLFKLQGFHPDSFPQDLIAFRGDGETGLAYKLEQRGYRAVYHPGAKVYHHIPNSRLTVEYFQKRFFNQGISDSYTAIRKNGGAEGVSTLEFNPANPAIPKYKSFTQYYHEIHKAYIEGYNFHLNAVRKSSQLLAWVLKENYFDYELPELENYHQTIRTVTRTTRDKQPKNLPVKTKTLASLVDTGVHLLEKNQHEQALISFQRAIDRDPTNAAAWAGIGQIAHQLDDERTAEAAFRRVYQLDPHQPALLDWIFPPTLRQTFDAAVSPHLQQDSGDYLFAPEEYQQPHKRLLDHYQVFAREVPLPVTGANFLEIGTGAGGVSYIAKKLGCDVIATDIGITDHQFDPQAKAGHAARRLLGIEPVEFAVSPENSVAQVINFKNGQKADYIFMRGVQFNRRHVGTICYADPARRDQGWLESSQWYTAEQWLPVLVDVFDNLNVGGRFINLGIFKLDQPLAQEVAGKLREMLQDRAELKITIHPHPQWGTITDMWLTKRRP